MAANMLDVTQHLAEQLKLMTSSVPTQMAPALLARVIDSLSERHAVPFSEAEQAKLCSMLKLEQSRLIDVLQTCGYVFEQCAYFGGTSEALIRELEAAGLKRELCDAFGAVWDSSGAELRRKLSERSICAKQVVQTNTSVHLEMGTQDVSRIKKPTAIVSITTVDQDSADKKQHTLNLEFNRDQLVEFSKKLDRIQDQLDALN